MIYSSLHEEFGSGKPDIDKQSALATCSSDIDFLSHPCVSYRSVTGKDAHGFKAPAMQSCLCPFQMTWIDDSMRKFKLGGGHGWMDGHAEEDFDPRDHSLPPVWNEALWVISTHISWSIRARQNFQLNKTISLTKKTVRSSLLT